MVNLVKHVEILALLGEINEVKDKLTSNEHEMYAHLKNKYESVDQGDFDDKICLEVLLRNISVRAGYGMHKSEATRVVDFISGEDDADRSEKK